MMILGDIMEKKEKDLKPFRFNVGDLVKKYKKRMEKNYDIYNSEEVKCPNCNWETTILTTQAKDEKEALKRVLNGEGLCEECFVEMISDI